MARNINLPTGATRTSEVGLVYQEIKSGGGATTFEIPKYCAVRIRSALAGLTVSLDTLLAATMADTEILILNVGRGTNSDNKETVTLTVSGACYIQLGVELDRP
jgi:hypothetical protein